jgi:NAD(P)-dependent dehydrogenase (short-subunit alcohol dehydrogenase family)
VIVLGIFVEGDIKTTFPQDFDYMLDINLRAVYYTSFLFHHNIAQSRGTIINISGEVKFLNNFLLSSMEQKHLLGSTDTV